MRDESTEQYPEQREAPFAILGAGSSGRALEAFFRRRGYACTLFDESGASGTERPGPEGFASFATIILSPGFALNHPWRRTAEASGKPCFGELGFAARGWRGPVYGVTGTNGKTTVTALLAQALGEAGRPAVAVGNIGRPFSGIIDDGLNDGKTIAVCEISSFQAEINRPATSGPSTMPDKPSAAIPPCRYVHRSRWCAPSGRTCRRS